MQENFCSRYTPLVRQGFPGSRLLKFSGAEALIQRASDGHCKSFDARYGEKNAYFPHTIQSPPIKNVVINGIHIAEIGQAVLSFQGVKYLANIGCQASMQEALELSERVVIIPVKDKSRDWEPDYTETHEIIKEGVS